MTVTLLTARISANYNKCCVSFFCRLVNKCAGHFVLIKRSAVFAEYFIHNSTVYHLTDFSPVKLILFRDPFLIYLIFIKAL